MRPLLKRGGAKPRVRFARIERFWRARQPGYLEKGDSVFLLMKQYTPHNTHSRFLSIRSPIAFCLAVVFLFTTLATDLIFLSRPKVSWPGASGERIAFIANGFLPGRPGHSLLRPRAVDAHDIQSAFDGGKHGKKGSALSLSEWEIASLQGRLEKGESDELWKKMMKGTEPFTPRAIQFLANHPEIPVEEFATVAEALSIFPSHTVERRLHLSRYGVTLRRSPLRGNLQELVKTRRFLETLQPGMTLKEIRHLGRGGIPRPIAPFLKEKEPLAREDLDRLIVLLEEGERIAAFRENHQIRPFGAHFKVLPFFHAVQDLRIFMSGVDLSDALLLVLYPTEEELSMIRERKGKLEGHVPPGALGAIWFYVEEGDLFVTHIQSIFFRKLPGSLRRRYDNWASMLLLVLEDYARDKNIERILIASSEAQLKRFDKVNPNLVRFLYDQLPTDERFGYTRTDLPPWVLDWLTGIPEIRDVVMLDFVWGKKIVPKQDLDPNAPEAQFAALLTRQEMSRGDVAEDGGEKQSDYTGGDIGERTSAATWPGRLKHLDRYIIDIIKEMGVENIHYIIDIGLGFKRPKKPDIPPSPTFWDFGYELMMLKEDITFVGIDNNKMIVDANNAFIETNRERLGHFKNTSIQFGSFSEPARLFPQQVDLIRAMDVVTNYPTEKWEKALGYLSQALREGGRLVVGREHIFLTYEKRGKDLVLIAFHYIFKDEFDHVDLRRALTERKIDASGFLSDLETYQRRDDWIHPTELRRLNTYFRDLGYDITVRFDGLVTVRTNPNGEPIRSQAASDGAKKKRGHRPGMTKREAVKTISYPAAGADIETVELMARLFPNVERILLIDPAYKGLLRISGKLPSQALPVSILYETYKTTKEMFQLVEEREKGYTVISRETGQKIEIVLVDQYISQYMPEVSSSPSIHIVKTPDDMGALSMKAAFYAKMTQNMKIGDYLLIAHAYLRKDVLDQKESGLEKLPSEALGLDEATIVNDSVFDTGLQHVIEGWLVYQKTSESNPEFLEKHLKEGPIDNPPTIIPLYFSDEGPLDASDGGRKRAPDPEPLLKTFHPRNLITSYP